MTNQKTQPDIITVRLDKLDRDPKGGVALTEFETRYYLFLNFTRRWMTRFLAMSRWRDREVGGGLRRSSLCDEEGRDWRSGRELRQNADIVAPT